MKFNKIVSLVFVILFTFLGATCFASSINMNLASNNTETEVVVNNINDNIDYEIPSSQETRTNSTVMKSVNEVTTTTTNNGFGISDILNVLLIAVGLVIILLAVAILIRLR